MNTISRTLLVALATGTLLAACSREETAPPATPGSLPEDVRRRAESDYTTEMQAKIGDLDRKIADLQSRGATPDRLKEVRDARDELTNAWDAYQHANDADRGMLHARVDRAYRDAASRVDRLSATPIAPAPSSGPGLETGPMPGTSGGQGTIAPDRGERDAYRDRMAREIDAIDRTIAEHKSKTRGAPGKAMKDVEKSHAALVDAWQAFIAAKPAEWDLARDRLERAIADTKAHVDALPTPKK